MIYTSYFAKIKELDLNGLVPIAICGSVPYNYYGAHYPKLAPRWNFFSKWLETKDNDYYIKNYNDLVLSKLKPELVYKDLYNLAGETSNFAMICYETPNKFCHRHLVSRWLSDHGIPCQEWKSQEEF